MIFVLVAANLYLVTIILALLVGNWVIVPISIGSIFLGVYLARRL